MPHAGRRTAKTPAVYQSLDRRLPRGISAETHTVRTNTTRTLRHQETPSKTSTSLSPFFSLEIGQVFPGFPYRRMIRSKRFLLDFQRAPVEGDCGAVVSFRGDDPGKQVQDLCDLDVAATEGFFPDRECAPRMRLGSVKIAARRSHRGQVAECYGNMRMVRADALFVYRQRPTIQAFRALVVLPRPQDAGQVVQSRPKLGMLGTVRFLEHAKRSPVEPSC